ncbi:hypothetical protein [Propioniciclava soli]|uniref:Uncharacterized protein n=1 Tax=Propioniciclava soli TaxID=2775081 RepID=A0ABZ3CBP5_9ACTN|nr:hypothetical protein [Propioniciclava soli]
METLPVEAELDALLTVAAHVARACGRPIVDERPRVLDVAATKSSVTDVAQRSPRSPPTRRPPPC